MSISRNTFCFKRHRCSLRVFVLSYLQSQEIGMAHVARLAPLLANLVRHFLDELRMLCFDLGVDYDELPGEGKTAKAGDFPSRHDRSSRISKLVRYCSQHRPNLPWQDILTEGWTSQDSPRLHRSAEGKKAG
jgi:hypothetical protein